MRLARLLLLPLAVAALLACGCRRDDKHQEVATSLQQVVNGKPLVADNDVWTDVRAFYAQRRHEPAWVEGAYPARKAGAALAVLHAAVDHGLDPADYSETDIVTLRDGLTHKTIDAPDRTERLAEFDVRVTTALLALGHDVALGRTRPDAIDGRWKARRHAPDFAGILSRLVDGDIATWLDAVRPRHDDYVKLQKAYADLRGQKEKGGWPVVPAKSLTRGASSPAVVTLRQRLGASGELTGAAAAGSPVFDSEVEAAVKAFQELHGMNATGVLDKATVAEMNVPIGERMRQVALNLERWRWMPDDLGERHLMVNIPSFHLLAREHAKTVMDIRVVVGKRGNETPIFSDEMETVVFSPYWNIPDSIKQGETAPEAMRDPAYLERNNIEILRGSRLVSPASVDWSDAAQLRELTFRQRPGATNALGHVKFLFPNDFDVYLHDTPADSLFERQRRAFSHGCVRVEEPEVLANYVLRGYPEWTGPRILEAMHSGDEQHVRLKEKIPVHIVYFTSWVDDNGGLHFQPDIYGYDGRQRDGE